MNFTLRFVGLASWVFIVSAAACGGKVNDNTGTGGGPGAGGSSAGTGGTRVGSGGSSVGSATCSDVCRHLLDSGCYPGTLDKCAKDCEGAVGNYPNCAAVIDQYFACLASAKIVCDPSSDTLQIPECRALGDQVKSCQGSNPPPPPPPPPIGDGGPNSCPTIPTPSTGMSCSGGGGGGTSTTTGGQEPTCFSECTDSGNNSWASNCVGTTCSCTYNGQEFCKCVVNGPTCFAAPPCCPGTL